MILKSLVSVFIYILNSIPTILELGLCNDSIDEDVRVDHNHNNYDYDNNSS